MQVGKALLTKMLLSSSSTNEAGLNHDAWVREEISAILADDCAPAWLAGIETEVANVMRDLASKIWGCALQPQGQALESTTVADAFSMQMLHGSSALFSCEKCRHVMFWAAVFDHACFFRHDCVHASHCDADERCPPECLHFSIGWQTDRCRFLPSSLELYALMHRLARAHNISERMSIFALDIEDETQGRTSRTSWHARCPVKGCSLSESDEFATMLSISQAVSIYIVIWLFYITDFGSKLLHLMRHLESGDTSLEALAHVKHQWILSGSSFY